MKKIIKIISAILCCLVILFLLLPFVVPSQNASSGQAAQGEQQTVVPQIFTSNPLTKLVQRLARLFKKDQPEVTPQNEPLTQSQAKARFGTVIDGGYDGETDTSSFEAEEGQPLPATDQAANSYQNEETEWFLIQQTAPQTGVSGMHEINAKDNAYERYVKQERNARFTPSATIRKRKTVPDSKLARLFRPIKRLFGMDDSTPVEDAFPTNAAAAKTGKTDSLGRDNKSSNLAQFKNPTPPQSNLALGRIPTNSNTNPALELLSMINPQQAIQDAAEMVANSKYPNPKNKQEQAAREQLRAAKQKQYYTYANQRLQQRLLEMSQGQEGKDEIPAVVSGCSTKGAFISNSQLCEIADNSNVKTLRLENQQRFYQSIGKPLPNAPVMVILSKADPDDLRQLFADLEESKKNSSKQTDLSQEDLTMEKYQFMFSNKNCSNKNSCYWVAANVPPSPDTALLPRLKDTVEGSGVHFSPYENETTRMLDKAFEQNIMEKLPPQMPKEQQEKIRQNAVNTHTPYVLVDAQELRAIQEQNKELLRQAQNKQGSPRNLIAQGNALYAGSAQTALQLSQDLGESFIFYGKDNLSLDSNQNPTTTKRSTQLTDELIGLMQYAGGIVRDIIHMASQESVTNYMKPTTQGLNKQLNEGKKQFEKTGQTPVISKPQ